MLTQADYINYLIVTTRNYTCTNLADHLPGVSHDQVNRFLANNAFDASDLRTIVRPFLEQSSGGFLLIDDSVQDKKYSKFIEMAKVQYSGNSHGLVTGINLVNLVYSSREPGDFMPVDFRIYTPETDGLTKNDHFQEMISGVVQQNSVATRTVLFDSWYASVENLKLVHRAGWTFFTTLKSNRLVSLSKDSKPQRLDTVERSATAWRKGVPVRLKAVPFDLRLFKMVSPDGDVEWIVTNAAEPDLQATQVQEITRTRWQIEEFHRSFKQLTGSEKCQCRRAVCQRNHLTCCYLAWMSLRQAARQAGKTIYQVSQLLWAEYMRTMLQKTSVPLLTSISA